MLSLNIRTQDIDSHIGVSLNNPHDSVAEKEAGADHCTRVSVQVDLDYNETLIDDL